MKLSRYFSNGVCLVLITGSALSFSGCGPVNRIIGKDRLNQGILKYNQGKTTEAVGFFTRASELIPDDPKVWVCLGAVTYKKIRNADQGDVPKLANQALGYYRNALEKATDCKTKDNAIGYIATIYGDDLKQPDVQREWLLKRTTGECTSKDIKAQTFYSLAVKDWQCAYDQSTRYQDKQKATSDPFHARNFYFAPDKEKFDKCLANAFENIDKSLAEKAEYSEAHSYKSLLWREKQKASSNDADRKKFVAEAEKEAKISMEQAVIAKAQAEAEAAKKEAEGVKKK